MIYQPDISSNLAAILRGEAPCGNSGWKLLKLGRQYYQDGKDGMPHFITFPPAHIDRRAVNMVERFCTACWEMGRADRAKELEEIGHHE